MSAKQLKARARRSRQKANKHRHRHPSVHPATPVLPPPTADLFLGKPVQFDELHLNSDGFALRTRHATVVGLDYEGTGAPFQVTLKICGGDGDDGHNYRVEALMGMDRAGQTFTATPSDLINFRH